jgi:hypothetical protein
MDEPIPHGVLSTFPATSCCTNPRLTVCMFQLLVHENLQLAILPGRLVDFSIYFRPTLLCFSSISLQCCRESENLVGKKILVHAEIFSRNVEQLLEICDKLWLESLHLPCPIWWSVVARHLPRSLAEQHGWICLESWGHLPMDRRTHINFPSVLRGGCRECGPPSRSLPLRVFEESKV